MPNPSIKDEGLYRELRDDGASAQKAARIANAAARDGRKAVGRRGGKAEDLDDRTVPELRDRARELGISGVFRLRKQELVDRIRSH
ncbi:hypothetical protein GCM10009846_23230 [Agrococcus versicolor]|uniref:Rho termination factor-like N-terminal domain-containing protein n=1 Tax=Agrococcus versicolor TaxID=501482 RepID=A0ABN3AVP0_9MICO